ncbi:MAG: SGNH/GDSL hydrolase family protein [Elusimicrobia bacterium]|nr:SGNH/GDSL hydrolase family protein [Elusimicrobiota bacterium]
MNHGPGPRPKPGACLAVLLLGLVIIESALRAYYDTRRALERPPAFAARIHESFYTDLRGCMRIKPHARGWHKAYDAPGDVMVEVNSQGIRGPELMSSPAKRFVFIGDSITFDGGVVWEDSFPAIVQRKFRDEGLEGWETVNLGMTDTGVVQYLAKVEHHGLALKPDMVVLCLYLNDSRPPQGFIGQDGQKGWEWRLKGSLLHRLYVVKAVHYWMRYFMVTHEPGLKARLDWVPRYVKKAYHEDSSDWKKLVEEARYDWGAAWTEESWRVIAEHAGKIKKLCDSRGVLLGIVLFPVSAQVYMERLFDGADFPQRRAASMARDLGVPFLDLLPALRPHAARRLYCDHCHLTKEGNAVVAEILHRHLRSLFPEGRRPLHPASPLPHD